MNIQKLFSRLQPNSQTPETPQIDHLLLINKISNLQEIVSQQESTILELQQEIKILKSQKSLAPSRAKSISVSEILNSNSNSNSEIVISRPISRSRVPNLPRATFDFSEIQRTLSEAEEVIQGSVERKGKEVEREKQVIQQAKTAQCRKPEMAKNAEFSAVKAQGVPEKPVKTLKKPVPKQQVCSSSGISQGYDKDGVMTFKIKIDDFEQIRNNFINMKMDGERKNNFTSVMRLPQVDQKMASGAIQVLGSHVILDEAENLQFELDGTVLVVKMFAVDQKKLRKMILSFMESYESFNEIWTGFDEKE